MSEKIQIMRGLADWFKEYGWTSYFNQKNSDNYPIFHANTNSKADLIIQKNSYHISVEVKPGIDHQDILNGTDQVLRYAGEYYSGRAIYTIEEKPVKINAFTFATKYSQSGFLYSSEATLNYLDYNYLKLENDMTEKPITHTITRFLWRSWEKGLASDHYEGLRQGRAAPTIILPNKPKVGIIITKTSAKTKQCDKMPYLYLNSNEFIPMGCNIIYAFQQQPDIVRCYENES